MPYGSVCVPFHASQTISITACPWQRLFFAAFHNNNAPLSPNEMHDLIPWKLPDVILRTLTATGHPYGHPPVADCLQALVCQS